MAGWSSDLVGAHIAFGCLLNRLARVNVDDWQAFLVIDFNHANVVVWAAVGTRRATDTGLVVDVNVAALGFACNRASGTTDHANGIEAMHAGIGNHPVFMCRSLAIETRIVVVGGCTGSNTIVASGATIEIDHHGFCPIDKSLFHEKFK